MVSRETQHALILASTIRSKWLANQTSIEQEPSYAAWPISSFQNGMDRKFEALQAPQPHEFAVQSYSPASFSSFLAGKVTDQFIWG